MTAGLKIGTRGSPLALAQAAEVKAKITAAHRRSAAPEIEIVVIKTSGDIIQDRLLLEEGGKGLFTKEIEDRLLAGDIDLAVHSTKDVPAKLPEGLIIGAYLEREDPRDAFLSPVANSLNELPVGAVVGTSSLRRQAQILKLRHDLKIVPLRGNVETRLKKMHQGEVAATLLAVAGLNRLGLAGEITSFLEISDMIPAPGQGAVAVEVREGDEKIAEYLAPINHFETALAVRVERAISLSLGASCRMPLGALAQGSGKMISARAALFSPDGQSVWKAEKNGSPNNPEAFGIALGAEILAKADPALLKTYRIL